MRDNTDGIGLLRDLVVNLGLQLEGANILILGAGGATRGIVGPLLEMQPSSLRIANRTIDKAEALAEHFSRSGPVSACRFNMVPVTEDYDLIINATSAGVKGETFHDVYDADLPGRCRHVAHQDADGTGYQNDPAIKEGKPGRRKGLVTMGFQERHPSWDFKSLKIDLFDNLQASAYF